MCVCSYVCEGERERVRERDLPTVCVLQHHHSSKILLTTDCRVWLRTYRKQFSWAMERQGLGWTAWLDSFISTGLLSYNFPQIHREGKKRKKKENRDREWKKRRNLGR